MKHELKILPAYFEAVLSGEKTFEIRNNNDRGFRKGDTLVLREFDPDLSSSTLAMCYTGRTIERVVSYVSNYEQQPGFVVLGLKQQRMPEGWTWLASRRGGPNNIYIIFLDGVSLGIDLTGRK